MFCKFCFHSHDFQVILLQHIRRNAINDTERILIIDDVQHPDRHEKLCLQVQKYLGSMGYAVESAHTGTEGLKKAIEGDFHAVILDVMLPEMDGFEVFRQLRTQSRIPVLTLPSRGDETDRIVDLEIGADNYLPKTFSTRELLARLRSVIRQFHMTMASEDHREDTTIILRCDSGFFDVKNFAAFAALNIAFISSLKMPLRHRKSPVYA